MKTRIHFQDLGVTVEADAERTLLEVCLDEALPMETACGGFAACNSCRVRVLAGALSPVDEMEAPFLDRPDQRLGCQARVMDCPGGVRLVMDPGDQ